jgi:pimeloyl-ACP methyl ester carboxylesterase
MFRYLQWSARVPGVPLLLMQSLRVRALRRLPMTFGWLAKRPIDPEVMDAYVAPVLSNAAVRRDVTKVLAGISARHTQAAAERFHTVRQPLLLVWSREDRFFPFAHAVRMSQAFPTAQLEEVTDSYAFIPEDQPQRLAKSIATFVDAGVTGATGLAR